MKLVDILPVENIKIPLTGKTKDEIITELVDVLAASNPLIDKKTVLSSILDREKTMSTGIGQGIAIPHGKSRGIKEIHAVLGISPGGVDFDAIDGKPVYLFFLLAAPEGPTGPHLRCLSLISRLLNLETYRNRLIQCATPKDAFLIIDEGEQHIMHSGN